MIPYPDLNCYGGLKQDHIDWLLRSGVTVDAIIHPATILLGYGYRAQDGRFEDDQAGAAWLVLPEAEDVVYWQPRTGELATWNGRAFALGEEAVDNPGTYSFDCRLNLFADPLAWLQRNRDGCVILDWSRAWSRLHDKPRVAVDERLLFQYKRYMKPPRGPETFVLTERRAAA